MTREEYMAAIRRRSEIRQEMETLQQTLARENRDMTDAERQQFAALRAEDDALMVGCVQYESERSSERSRQFEEQRAQDSQEASFGRLLRSIASGRGIPEDLAACRDEEGNFRFAYNRADEQLRADTIQQAASTKNITPVYIQDYIRELTPQTIIGQVGARIQSGITGQWNFPTVKGLKATWYGENDAVTPQTMEFGVKTITPHRLPIRVDISNRAINQTAGAVKISANCIDLEGYVTASEFETVAAYTQVFKGGEISGLTMEAVEGTFSHILADDGRIPMLTVSNAGGFGINVEQMGLTVYDSGYHTFIVTKNGDDYTFYLDNCKIYGNKLTYPQAETGEKTLYIGGWESGWGMVSGTIMDIRIYNKCIDANTVSELNDIFAAS